MDKVLSIVIPVYNKYNFTKSCLKDLTQLTSDHEIIIVDNASSDETKSELENSTEIKYIRNQSNLGFAQACNIGYDHASANNVLFLNNDIRVKDEYKNWTQHLIKYCNEGLVGPTMGLLDKDLNFVQEANKPLIGNSYLSGWCIASSKENWKKLEIKRNPIVLYDKTPPTQIFSEEFGLAYFEDTDLSFRARKLAIPLIVSDVPVVHFGKQTSSQLNTYQLYKSARQVFIKIWRR
jgi:GT2 family glycosyltransferase